MLEPYILNDRITKLPPVVMNAFVNHFRDSAQLEAVERCLLHMDLMVRCRRCQLTPALPSALAHHMPDNCTGLEH